MDRCEITDLAPEWCGHCQERAARPAGDPFDAPAADLGPWFYARFAGECSGCGEDIRGGDRVRADGEGGYLAECCGDDA